MLIFFWDRVSSHRLTLKLLSDSPVSTFEILGLQVIPSLCGSGEIPQNFIWLDKYSTNWATSLAPLLDCLTIILGKNLLWSGITFFFLCRQWRDLQTDKFQDLYLVVKRMWGQRERLIVSGYWVRLKIARDDLGSWSTTFHQNGYSVLVSWGQKSPQASVQIELHLFIHLIH